MAAPAWLPSSAGAASVTRSPARSALTSPGGGHDRLRLAAEAVQAALADAGLQPSEVDGLVTFTMDSNAEVAVARELGIGELRFFSQIGYGGGAAGGAAQQGGGGPAAAG